MIKHATLGAEEETKMTSVNADLLVALEYIRLKQACGASPKEIDDIARAAIEAAERDESADAEREQARAEHLGELAVEREMVQAQTPVVNVEAREYADATMRTEGARDTLPREDLR